MTRIVSLVVVVLVLLGVCAMAYFNRYAVAWTDHAGQILWNADEAYLFIQVGRNGWRGSYLRYVVRLANNFLFQAGSPPTETRRAIQVFTLTSDGVEAYPIPETGIGGLTNFAGNIYAREGGMLIRWTGRSFVRSTDEEDQRFRAATTKAGANFDNVNGWSGRSNVLNRAFGDTEFKLVVGGRQLSLIAHISSYPEQWKAIDIKRPGREPQRVWYQDQSGKYVSRKEYEAFFK